MFPDKISLKGACMFSLVFNRLRKETNYVTNTTFDLGARHCKLLKSSLFLIISHWRQLHISGCLLVYTYRRSMQREISQALVRILFCNLRHQKTLLSRLWEVTRITFRNKPRHDPWLWTTGHMAALHYTIGGGKVNGCVRDGGRMGLGITLCFILRFNSWGKEAVCHCSLSRVLTRIPNILAWRISSLLLFTQLEANNGIHRSRKMKVKSSQGALLRLLSQWLLSLESPWKWAPRALGLQRRLTTNLFLEAGSGTSGVGQLSKCLLLAPGKPLQHSILRHFFSGRGHLSLSGF